MSTAVLRKALKAWRLFTLQRLSLLRTVSLARALNSLQAKRRTFALLLTNAQHMVSLQTNSRISLVTKKLQRLLERWNRHTRARKAKSTQTRLACQVYELSVGERTMGRWKAVVDRNVRLKRIAMGKTDAGGWRPWEGGGRAKKAVVQAMWRTKRQLQGLESTLTQSFLLTTQRSQPCLSPTLRPAEHAHFQYFEMQQRFSPPPVPYSDPAPGPSPPQTSTALALSHYRDLHSRLRQQLPAPRADRRTVFRRWRQWCDVQRAERAVGYEYEAKLAGRWLEAVGRYVRNVGRIMLEVGVFADISLQRRIINLWKGLITAKKAEFAQQLARKTKKRTFHRLKLFSKARKASKSLNEAAFSHYGHSLLLKSLYCLCKLQRLRRISKGFRTKSLFKSCFFAWQQKFQAHRTFQSLQIRPIFAPREQTALWLWWETCFHLKFPSRSGLVKALGLKWSKRGRIVLRNWSDFARKSRILKAFVRGMSRAGGREGLDMLGQYASEVVQFGQVAQAAFRAVRLKVTFGLWKRWQNLTLRKRVFVQKRLFSHWRSKLKRQLSEFALYRRSSILRKSWRKLVPLLALRSKRQAAKAWSAGRAEHHVRSEKKLAVIMLLRNVFRRKAMRKLWIRAAKYYQKATKRQLLDYWKCFHFRSKWKQHRLELAQSFTEERLRSARYGPNEGKLVQRSVFTAWKVHIHRHNTLNTVIQGRTRRRQRKALIRVLAGWRNCSKRAIHGEIKELALIGAAQTPKEDRFRPILDFRSSKEVKSDIRDEIARLEKTIRATLSETAHHAFTHL